MAILAVISITVNALLVIAVVCIGVRFSNKLADCKKHLADDAKVIHDMMASVEDIKVELATAKSLMFAYEARLKGEQGAWCLEHEGNKKWYSPGTLLRTESADGRNTTDFSYDLSTGNVTATSRKSGTLISSVTFSKFGTPLNGNVYSDGVVSKAVSYDKLGQVIK